MSPDQSPSTGFVARLRRRAGTGRTRRIVLHSRTRIDKHGQAIRDLVKQDRARQAHVKESGTQHERLARRVDDLDARLREIEWDRRIAAADRSQRSAQLGAVEERLNRLERLLDDRPLASDADGSTEARRLVDEVRAEHAQIRARLQATSTYEERLRRVEESVAGLFDGDPRHPV